MPAYYSDENGRWLCNANFYCDPVESRSYGSASHNRIASCRPFGDGTIVSARLLARV
jgi:hypothetical protein